MLFRNTEKQNANKDRCLRVFLRCMRRAAVVICCLLFSARSFADISDEFEIDRWHITLHKIQNVAIGQKISPKTINAVIQESSFVPQIIHRDKNQPEFVLTMRQYLTNSLDQLRIKNGKNAAKKYSKLLAQTEKKFGIPKNVILALWGMESDYGTFKSRYQLSDSFLTLIYDGRREQFFTEQLLALMKIADKNKLDVKSFEGSWAGAMGHFQFIPTTLRQYGVDGNGDGKIDIMNSVADAMASAGNYLKKMGWKKGERILKSVRLPPGFKMEYCDGTTKLKPLEWRGMGISGVPKGNKNIGLICEASMFPLAYLTYDNFYRIKKWNNSNYYAVAVALLADKLNK
ncbi:MAG: lytic murein transglycosylase [Rickettsiales bacterium]|jgi:membrane-bound lytic murein transglycosylase B|nr:lytic murein transglycosylase [Rickettsiales bacterium]